MSMQSVNLNDLDPTLRDALWGVKVFQNNLTLKLFFMAMGQVDSCEENIVGLVELAQFLNCLAIEFNLDGRSFDMSIETLSSMRNEFAASDHQYLRESFEELFADCEGLALSAQSDPLRG
jgi:hypothetical protein